MTRRWIPRRLTGDRRITNRGLAHRVAAPAREIRAGPLTNDHTVNGSVTLRVGNVGARLSGEAVSASSSPASTKVRVAGFRFSAELIVVAIRWYLRYGLSYRDVEELLIERGF